MSGGRDDFSDIFFHGICPLDVFSHCPLLGNNYRRGWRGFLGVYVVFFVGVLDCWEVFGLDKNGGPKLCGFKTNQRGSAWDTPPARLIAFNYVKNRSINYG
jgi:hypothetical protein